MNAVQYRAATRDDAAVIVTFQQAMASETEDLELEEETCAQGVAAVFDDSAKGRYFVAEAAGEVIASLMITYEWSDWRNGVVWWIQSVFVRPDHRGRRVYAGLYSHVRALVNAEPGIRGIRLYVDQRNASAQEVYRRCGMNGEHYQVFEWMKG